MTNARWLFAAFVAAILVVSVACGGGGGKSASVGGSGSTTSQVLDLSSAAQKLLTVQSFRFKASLKIDMGGPSDGSGGVFGSALLAALGNVQAEGAFVAPGDFDVTLTAFGKDTHYVQVGDEAWINDGSGWQPERTVDASTLSQGTLPGLPFDLKNDVLSGAKTKTETVNGAKTTRYSFDQAALTDVATKLGKQTAGMDKVSAATLDVWLTDDGLPVKLVAHVAGDSKLSETTIDLSYDVTDLNSDIKIEKPLP